MADLVIYAGMDCFFDIGLTNGLRNKLTEALAVKDNERAKYI